MRTGRILLAVLLVLVLAAVGTYVAGERVELVVLRTVGDDGSSHATTLWVVDHDGVPWVRVADASRAWFQRLSRHPRAQLLRGGATQTVDARPQDSAEARALIDRRFREKYGVVDWWYGVLLRRNAVPVRLIPVAGSRRDRAAEAE
jgi:hypothetical protein